MARLFALALIAVLAASSLMLVGTAWAATPKPSVPEFTVELVDRSYDVPVTYTTTTDPFTGKQVTTSSGGYRITNKTIDVTIKNQAYTSTTLDNGSVIQLYCSVRTKGHFGDWSDTSGSNGYFFKRVAVSSGEYTTITLILAGGYYGGGSPDLSVPNDGKEDFQVKAETGYYYPYFGEHIMPLYYPFQVVEESGWSNTQTLTIGGSATPTPTATWSPSTPSPTQNPVTPQPTASTTSPTTSSPENLFGLGWAGIAIVVLAVVIALMAVGMVVLWRKVAAK